MVLVIRSPMIRPVGGSPLTWEMLLFGLDTPLDEDSLNKTLLWWCRFRCRFVCLLVCHGGDGSLAGLLCLLVGLPVSLFCESSHAATTPFEIRAYFFAPCTRCQDDDKGVKNWAMLPVCRRGELTCNNEPTRFGVTVALVGHPITILPSHNLSLILSVPEK